MGNKGEMLVKKEDKRVEQSSNTAELAITDSSCLVSMDESIKQVLTQLENTNVYSVGLVGKNGAGKTTLAKEVGKKCKELNVFERVVFITVSIRGNEKNMQDQIAKALGLRWVTEDLRERARQIYHRLQSGERILVVLDDIWHRIDLKQVGFPGSQDNKRCKLILTTFNPSIIDNMDCHCLFLFHHYLLPEDAACSLFCKWAGIGNVDSLDSNTLALALQLVKECQGLPVNLVVAGGCLRGKSFDKWEDAMNENIFQYSNRRYLSRLFVKWSYKELNSKVAKSMFLITCLFLKNEILIEDLSNYAISLGLCSGKNQVNAAINELIYCGLVMHYDDESKDHVIIHQHVRSDAHFIVKEEYPVHWSSVQRCCMQRGSLSDSEISQWKKEEFDGLVHQIFHMKESSSSTSTSSSIVAFPPNVAVVPAEPSGKMVDFKGLCHVDESYLPLLMKACEKYPHLIKCQDKHTKKLKQSAFDSLGHLLYMLNNVSVHDWVYVKDQLKEFWDLAEHMKFDLKWLKHEVDTALSSTEIHRNIDALSKEEEKLNTKAAKLSQKIKDSEAKAAKLHQQLNDVEAQAECFRTDIAQLESKYKLNDLTTKALRKEEEERDARVAKLRQQLHEVEENVAYFRAEIALLQFKFKPDGFAITHVSKAPVFSKVTRYCKKVFDKRK